MIERYLNCNGSFCYPMEIIYNAEMLNKTIVTKNKKL